MGDGGLEKYETAAFEAMSAELDKNSKLEGEKMGYLVTFHVILSMCFGKEYV